MGWKKKLVEVSGTAIVVLPEDYSEAVLLSVNTGTITSYREIYNGGPGGATAVGAQSVKIEAATSRLYPKLEIITSGPATLEIIVYG